MKHHINGVHHVSVSVPDIDTARRFYIELLGADEVFTGEWEPGNAWIDAIVGIEDSAAKSFMARLKNIYVEVFEYVSPKSPPQDPARPVSHNGYTHIAFQVDDIQAVHDRMVEAGLTFNTAPDMSDLWPRLLRQSVRDHGDPSERGHSGALTSAITAGG